MKGQVLIGFLISAMLSQNSLAKISHTVAPVLAPAPTKCIIGTFSSTGDQWWRNIVLELRNNCGKNVDFKNTTITFNNKNALNTNFWGDFYPLPYPDNSLTITSQPSQNGIFLATLKLHFATYPGSTTLLPAGQAIFIKYGAPSDGSIAGSANVYLESAVSETGNIALMNNAAKPAEVTQGYALVHVTANGQKVSDVQLPWGSQQTLEGLPVGTYSITTDNVIATSGKVYQGNVTPPSVTLSSKQTAQVRINFNTATFDINQIRLNYNVPALGGLKRQNGASALYISGYRKWGDSTLATSADQFHLGSCTKAMTATLLAIYVERGLLSWDTTLDKLFPELSATMNPAFKSVSLGMLTTHMSGIGVNSYDNASLWAYISNPNLDPVEGRKYLARVVLSAAPDNSPGKTYAYNNYNYVIAAAALENLTKNSWENLITSQLFIPLAMNSCGFGQAGNKQSVPPDQPWGHSTDANLNPVPVFSDNPQTIGPAGTVHCSMSDWAKFGQVHLDGYNKLDTPILKASSFVKLHTPYPGQTYTYGGWLKFDSAGGDGPTFWHNGSNTMNFAQIWLVPLKKTLILSATNIAYKGDEATNEVYNALSNLTLMP
ncbi:chitinase [Legionella beliardensis]|uniref:Chitinase n=1 Tax=Legionella beliardensis TaxID=91822 RepID=A0A378I7Z0_9GAMM|nr:serine hydrolase domain-containing protein [Legionella beliardensis]STX28514.1 chitinase [Legionella beliardensis]